MQNYGKIYFCNLDKSWRVEKFAYIWKRAPWMFLVVFLGDGTCVTSSATASDMIRTFITSEGYREITLISNYLTIRLNMHFTFYSLWNFLSVSKFVMYFSGEIFNHIVDTFSFHLADRARRPVKSEKISMSSHRRQEIQTKNCLPNFLWHNLCFVLCIRRLEISTSIDSFLIALIFFT